MKRLSATRRKQIQNFDLLATIVLLTRPDGQVVFANAAAEDVLGMGRRALEQLRLQDLFKNSQEAALALAGAQGGAFSALRYDAHLLRVGQDPIPVHVIVAPTDSVDEVLIELLPLEQQSRQDR
ncbi:MAG: Nitrogen regulation protein, partial [Pseudomonadota bacterium]